MWPSSGYVSYDHEVDSVTGMAYPQWFVQEPINAKPGDFPVGLSLFRLWQEWLLL